MTIASVKTTAAPAPILIAIGRDALEIRSGAVIGTHLLEDNIPVALPALVPGADYYIHLNEVGDPVAIQAGGRPDTDVIGGFHFAPGGNASARSGGDDVPAINPYSCWDLLFRPTCTDPRGMAVVDMPDGSKVWVDIYKLGIDHIEQGTSRFGITIADGNSLPQKIDGKGRTKVLDYATAVEIYAHHGKQLLSYDEFRAAAFGVTEKTVAGRDPKVTVLDVARTSQRGIMQATGNLWDWGHDGDPDNPRASIFGGSWIVGDYAGSRVASLACWPEDSCEDISARGRSDHLKPAA